MEIRSRMLRFPLFLNETQNGRFQKSREGARQDILPCTFAALGRDHVGDGLIIIQNGDSHFPESEPLIPPIVGTDSRTTVTGQRRLEENNQAIEPNEGLSRISAVSFRLTQGIQTERQKNIKGQGTMPYLKFTRNNPR